jgi:hypothetical protein
MPVSMVTRPPPAATRTGGDTNGSLPVAAVLSHHVHTPWVIPATVLESIFLEAYPARRFQSAW